ncbi:unnamed protein product [Ascophyllum nodosum]
MLRQLLLSLHVASVLILSTLLSVSVYGYNVKAFPVFRSSYFTTARAIVAAKRATSTAGSPPNPRYIGAFVDGGRPPWLYRRYSSSVWPRTCRVVTMALPKLPNRSASAALFAAGVVFGCYFSGSMTANFRLYRTVPDIPKSMFQERASISGTVISVSDGDSIRVRHRPTIPLPLPGRKMEGKISEETLQVRLYAVDCPEIAHFGNPLQPFGEEAKQFTKDAVQGQVVRLKLLRLDQYKRAICKVEHGTWPFRKDVSEELLERGLGVLYRQGGAEYDGQKEHLAQIESKAKEKREGLWQHTKGETPAQYKARIRRGRKGGS